MKFFIDTANLDQIKEAQGLGVLDGVTTNPSLMAKEGITGRENILKHYLDICEAVDGDVSAEVISSVAPDVLLFPPTETLKWLKLSAVVDITPLADIFILVPALNVNPSAAAVNLPCWSTVNEFNFKLPP